MDRITQSMMEAFKEDLSVNIDDISLLFEYFSNYCVVNNVYGINDFDVEEISTGKNTQGIAGMMVRDHFLSFYFHYLLGYSTKGSI